MPIPPVPVSVSSRVSPSSRERPRRSSGSRPIELVSCVRQVVGAAARRRAGRHPARHQSPELRCHGKLDGQRPQGRDAARRRLPLGLVSLTAVRPAWARAPFAPVGRSHRLAQSIPALPPPIAPSAHASRYRRHGRYLSCPHRPRARRHDLGERSRVRGIGRFRVTLPPSSRLCPRPHVHAHCSPANGHWASGRASGAAVDRFPPSQCGFLNRSPGTARAMIPTVTCGCIRSHSTERWLHASTMSTSSTGHTRPKCLSQGPAAGLCLDIRDGAHASLSEGSGRQQSPGWADTPDDLEREGNHATLYGCSHRKVPRADRGCRCRRAPEGP